MPRYRFLPSRPSAVKLGKRDGKRRAFYLTAAPPPPSQTSSRLWAGGEGKGGHGGRDVFKRPPPSLFLILDREKGGERRRRRRIRPSSSFPMAFAASAAPPTLSPNVAFSPFACKCEIGGRREKKKREREGRTMMYLFSPPLVCEKKVGWQWQPGPYFFLQLGRGAKRKRCESEAAALYIPTKALVCCTPTNGWTWGANLQHSICHSKGQKY